jgi:hypothetical protein
VKKIRAAFAWVLRALKKMGTAALSVLRAFLLLLVPGTSWGRWSLCLAIVSILPPVLLGLSTGFNPLGAGIDTALLVILKILCIAISGDAFVIGLLGVLRHEERHFLVYPGIAIGLWLTIAELAWLIHLNESVYPLGLLG